MWSRLKQMLIKEFIQVLRDKRTRMVLIIPPMVQKSELEGSGGKNLPEALSQRSSSLLFMPGSTTT